ncbi:Histidin kinase, PAS and GAF domains-containing [Desulfonema limicola]|uniref:Histidin kinase, PAS and GAF domains-containing n=1 Tax=Desulfonema limicola TaxID=45656 RepID=A0A975BA39_9BACT|nr:histidine kinase dimerization/phosphoacceptor domain -containing protein [Desulfonema limicola]QTA81365.1 Histidin kinase, PAS and GAF domains-containing [Desulfonema limicola]
MIKQMDSLWELIKKKDVLGYEEIKILIHDLQVRLIDIERSKVLEKNSQKARIYEFQNKYSDLYQFVPVGYFIIDKKGFIKDANLSGTGILGSEKNFVIKTSLANYLFWKDRGKYQEHIKNLLKSSEPGICEVRLMRPDGSRSFVKLETIAVKDKKGSLKYFRTMICTERRREEDSVEKVLRIYRVINKVRPVLLSADNENDLVKNICRIIVDEGGYCMSRIDFIDPGSQKLQIAAQWGEKDNIPSKIKYLSENYCPSSAAVKTNSSYILRDILASPALGPWRLHAVFHGYAASIAIPLSANGKMTGSLCLYAREPDSFGAEESNLIEIFAENLSHGISLLREKNKRIKAEYDLQNYYNKLEEIVYERTLKLKQAIDEKEILLREIHHRVKNNMQVVSSLISIQEDQIADQDIKKMFRESQGRIMTMAMIHENLYLSDSIDQVELNQYFTGVASALLQTYGACEKITLETDIKDIFLNIDQAVPCGLIINELISNSLKYAFPGKKKGIIQITAFINDNQLIEISVSDNGIGIPDNIDLYKSRTLGFKLIKGLAENQLKGIVSMSAVKGTCCCICFSPKKDKKRI